MKKKKHLQKLKYRRVGEYLECRRIMYSSYIFVYFVYRKHTQRTADTAAREAEAVQGWDPKTTEEEEARLGPTDGTRREAVIARQEQLGECDALVGGGGLRGASPAPSAALHWRGSRCSALRADGSRTTTRADSTHQQRDYRQQHQGFSSCQENWTF